MTGSKRTGLVVQERDRQLLSELAVMRIIDREMTKLVAGFNSTRRANARLLQLTRTGLLLPDLQRLGAQVHLQEHGADGVA